MFCNDFKFFEVTIMANISVFNPVANPINKLFQSWLPRDWPFEDELGGQMKIDLSEDDRQFVVRADLPGVKKEDINVDIDGDRVTINAHTKSYKEEKEGKTVIHSERYEGRIYRSFSLGCDVDRAHAAASYKDGVLELKLPKSSNGKAKRLTVS